MRRGPKPSAESFSATAIGPVAASSASNADSAAFAQARECGLGFRKRPLEDRRGFDTASARVPDRLRRPSDPPPALELGEPHLLLQDMALQPGNLGGEQGARGRRSIALGLEGRDRLRRLACEVVATAFDCGNSTGLQVLDPVPGAVEPLPLLNLLGDGDRERPLGPVERSGSIAHLLIEDQQRVLIGDLLGDRHGAAANQRDQSLEHWWLALI